MVPRNRDSSTGKSLWKGRNRVFTVAVIAMEPAVWFVGDPAAEEGVRGGIATGSSYGVGAGYMGPDRDEAEDNTWNRIR